MAGSSEMLDHESQERRETRIWCGRPESAALRRPGQCNTQPDRPGM